MRVLICGGRNYGVGDTKRALEERESFDSLMKVLEVEPDEEPVTCVIHGGAPGVDSLADAWAKRQKIPVEVFPADWDAHGRAAGPLRNQRMLDEGKPDIVVAFPGGRGTADMLRRARKSEAIIVEVSID